MSGDPRQFGKCLRTLFTKGFAAYGKRRVGKRRPQLRPQRGCPEQPRRDFSLYPTNREDQEWIPVPAIVSEELFEIVQEQLKENQKRQRVSKRGARFLLQGLLQCKRCGYAYHGQSSCRREETSRGIRRAYYRCGGKNASRIVGMAVCDGESIRTNFLDDAIWEDVCSLLRDPKRLIGEYERRLESSNNQSTTTSDQLTRRIQHIKRAIARLIDAYEEGYLSKDEFEPRIRNAKERLGRLDEELVTATNERNEADELRLIIGHLDDFASFIHEGLDKADWHTRREIIRALIKRVEIDNDDIRVIYKVSPPPFALGPVRGQLQDHSASDRLICPKM